MNLETHLQDGERALARIWKATALRGVLAIAFAVVILVWPDIGLSTLIALFGAFALVSGVATIAGAFSLPARGAQRGWLVLEGLLGVAVGVVVFVWPGLSALGLLYAIAAWAIGLGVFEIALAFALPLSGGRTLLLALGGLLSIAFGVIMFAHPGAGAVALLALVAAFAFVTGVMQIAFALELRRVVVELEPSVRPRATREARDARLGEASDIHAGVAERRLARRLLPPNREWRRRVVSPQTATGVACTRRPGLLALRASLRRCHAEPGRCRRARGVRRAGYRRRHGVRQARAERLDVDDSQAALPRGAARHPHVPGLQLLLELHDILIMLFVSVVLAAALSRPTATLERRGMPLGLAVPWSSCSRSPRCS